MNASWPIALALALAACSSPIATSRRAGLQGYGVEAVTGESLGAMLARCLQPVAPMNGADRATSLAAECGQLHRTMHNQPGNSVTPGATP